MLQPVQIFCLTPIVKFNFGYFTFQLQNFYLVTFNNFCLRIWLSIWEDFILLFCFCSSSTISFSYLVIFKSVDLIFSNMSRAFPLTAFYFFSFHVNVPYFLISLQAPLFLLKIELFEYYKVATIEITFSPYLGFVLQFLLVCSCFLV